MPLFYGRLFISFCCAASSAFVVICFFLALLNGDGAPALLDIELFPCFCVVVFSAGCPGLVGHKSFSSAVFWVEIVQFFIADFLLV